MSDRPHLWMTVNEPEEGPVRFFLVPRGLRLPHGALKVRNMQLGVQTIDPDAVLEFEIDQAAAQAHIDDGWGQFVGRARDAWNDLLGRPGAEGPPDLTRWLGVTPGEVLVDEEKRRHGARTLLARAGRLLGRDLGEAELDRVEGQIVGLGQTIARESGRLAENLERAADAAVDAVRTATGTSHRDDGGEE